MDAVIHQSCRDANRAATSRALMKNPFCSSWPLPSLTLADVLVTGRARVGSIDLMLGGRSDPDF